jgi:cytochrome b pre-mRNA-processing protein 3
MLNFLFRGLTAHRPDAAALFDAITAKAREPHWYVEGQVPDTLDGRFAVLATLMALVLVRFESEGEEGDHVSVALTERFIHVMESEHRELGLGDPTLGKTVRKLVGMLARRTEWLRAACAGSADWSETVGESLYKGQVAPAALAHSAETLKQFQNRLAAASLDKVEQGEIP